MMESEPENINHRPFISKAIPFMQTKAGKCYLLVGLGCILVVVFGIGFLLYTVSWKTICKYIFVGFLKTLIETLLLPTTLYKFYERIFRFLESNYYLSELEHCSHLLSLYQPYGALVHTMTLKCKKPKVLV